MTGAGDLGVYIERVARRLYGEPNKTLSTASELRFGSHGSLAVKIVGSKRGTWYDHENQIGGGVIDMLAEKGVAAADVADWFRRELGIDISDGGKQCIVAVYSYVDENGKLIFQVVRFDPKDFRQRRPDDNGGWVWNLKGINRVPYHLDELVDPTRTDERIYVTEGEKDSDRLRRDWGVLATTCPGGAGKWSSKWNQYFEGREIVIIPDNDDAGRKHARDVAQAMSGAKARSCRIVNLRDLPPKGDVSDAMDHGLSQGELDDIIDSTEPFTPTQVEGGAPAFSEEALALEFGDLHADTLRFTPIWSKWHSWCGTHWRADDTLTAFDSSRDICRQASRRLSGEPKKEGFARSIASAKTVAAVASLARADRRIVTPHDAWDADIWTLVAGERTVDLRTGEIREPRQRDLCTKIAAVAPTETGCQLWLSFLDRITGGDPDLQAYLRRIAGYSLTGSTCEHAIFFLHGTGANGKGVFLNTLRAIWKDYAVTAPMETFVETRVGQHHHETELAYLRGARLVIAQETERGRRWAESKIKNLTGGDPIAARYMRQDFFEFVPQFKLLIAGNHKPGLRSVDEAIRRRFHLIPFIVTIPITERDPQLSEKLKAEWGGILQWAIEGCREWKRIGLAPPKLVRDATEKYLADEDALGRWIEENCARDRIYSELANKLYGDWKKWADAAGERPGTQKGFYKELDRRGFDRDRTEDGVMFFGIALRP
jgi:putative DNA primase/helicase